MYSSQKIDAIAFVNGSFGRSRQYRCHFRPVFGVWAAWRMGAWCIGTWAKVWLAQPRKSIDRGAAMMRSSDNRSKLPWLVSKRRPKACWSLDPLKFLQENVYSSLLSISNLPSFSTGWPVLWSYPFYLWRYIMHPLTQLYIMGNTSWIHVF